nr:hypothetical protein [Tanacetum cinerariifolium]
DGKGMAAEGSRDDAPIKGRRLYEEEVATERVSSDTEEIRLMKKSGVSKTSEGEPAWLKRKGIRSEQESAKKQKTTEEVPEEVKSCDKIPEEKIKELIRLIPIEEVYVEALQV